MREFNKRTLDEYVAEGKTVLVEFSADSWLSEY